MIVRPTGPLFKWFGSKWLAARHYPEPLHDMIVEPFAGGAGYSLWHASRKVIIWEQNAQLIELWTWLINSANATAIREIPIGLAPGVDIREIGLTAGQGLLLKHWQRTNNVGDCWTVSPWGHLPGQWTANTRARVAEEVELVRHWQVRATDWGELATYFVDPPYQKNYGYRMPPIDYVALSVQVRTLPHGAQAIVCEARHPSTGEPPTWLPFTDFRRSITSRRKPGNHTHSRELIWVGP